MGTFKNPDVWKQNLAYQIGDFVLYNGTVYMAIKPVPTGTEMSSDYWTVFEEGAIVPTGEISITENGEVDVTEYATANVNVEGGGTSTTDVYLWNGTDNTELMTVLPKKVEYLSGVSNGAQQYSEIAFTEITETLEIQGTPVTFHGIKLTDAPAGALLHITSPDDYTISIATGYAGQSDAMSVFTSAVDFLGQTVPMSLESMVTAGIIHILNV